jgi:phasin family protein
MARISKNTATAEPVTVEAAPTEFVAAPTAALQGTVLPALEKSVAEGRAAYFRGKAAADDAANALEATFATASKGVLDFNNKALDVLRANVDSTLDFAKRTINAKSVVELMSLHGDHARKQAETIVEQAKQFADLATKIAVEAAEQVRTQVAKAFKLPA